VVDDTQPFDVELRIPEKFIGEAVIGAAAWDEIGVTGITSITVNAATSSTVAALEVWPNSVIYMEPNQSLQLNVMGKFTDGVKRNITSGSLGTSYSSENPSIASITNDGLVHAQSPGYSMITVSHGRIVQEIPVIVSRLSLTAPQLTLSLNGTNFHRGDSLRLTATVNPGLIPQTVDAYLAIRLPDGTLLFFPDFTVDLRPVLTSWPVVPFSGEVFRYTFIGMEPAGSYAWLAAFTEPGTLNIIGSIVQAPFSFGP
jgi:hypothetical protein